MMRVVPTKVIVPIPLIGVLTSLASLAPLTTLTSSSTSHVPQSSPQLLPLSPPSTCVDPDALGIALAAGKRRTYGNVAPHVVLPFVLDDSGGLGKEAWAFLLKCRDKAEGQLGATEFSKLDWSCQAFTSYYLRSLSLASVRGWGHFFMTAASILPGAD